MKLRDINVSARLAELIEQQNYPPNVVDYLLKGIVHYVNEFRTHAKANPPVAILHALYENMQQYEKEAAEKIKVSCKSGCSFCCYINVDITDLEAQAIVEYCSENGIDINMQELEMPQLKCTFLKDNKCSVYSARPMACRKYFAVSAPERCDAQRYPKGGVINHISLDMEMMASAIYSLYESKPMPQQIIKAKNNG
jgi:Fe-S-cluster containining protein